MSYILLVVRKCGSLYVLRSLSCFPFSPFSHNTPSTCFTDITLKDFWLIKFTTSKPFSSIWGCQQELLPCAAFTHKRPWVGIYGGLHRCVYCLSDWSLQGIQKQYFMLSDPHPNLSVHSPHLALSLNVPGLHDAGLNVELVCCTP